MKFFIQPINSQSSRKNEDYSSFAIGQNDKNRTEYNDEKKENDTCLKFNQGYSTFLDIELENSAADTQKALYNFSTQKLVSPPFDNWLLSDQQHKSLTDLIETEALYFEKVAANKKNTHEDAHDDRSSSSEDENTHLLL